MADQKREVEVADAAAEETHGISPARSADYDETYGDLQEAGCD